MGNVDVGGRYLHTGQEMIDEDKTIKAMKVRARQ